MKKIKLIAKKLLYVPVSILSNGFQAIALLLLSFLLLLLSFVFIIGLFFYKLSAVIAAIFLKSSDNIA